MYLVYQDGSCVMRKHSGQYLSSYDALGQEEEASFGSLEESPFFGCQRSVYAC